MNVYDAIVSRRSTRKYLDKKIEDEKLKEILDAGIYAPSGGNSQSNHFFVIKNKAILKELENLVQEEFAKMEYTENMYKSLKNSIRLSKQGDYHFFYVAPMLIVVANKKDYGNNIADTACALENMMIMANNLDLGTCWINQLRWLNENPKVIEYFKILGMKDEETICGALSLGYPDSDDGLPQRQPLPRTGNIITTIE